MDEAAEQARIGTVLLQRYRIEALLGRGGMSTVYRGLQLSVKRPVAIKLIAGDLVRDPECVQRFRREAEAMARLAHPNTVRIYEFGVTEQDELFIVMELLEGLDLSELIHDQGALSLRDALNIAHQTLESLCEAHALGIVHRDLKPANIFLSRLPRGRLWVKIMDFGIADIDQHAERTRLTQSGVMIGTPAYMSPEQALGQKVDARSDLYSLGIILFEMLVGRTPFEGQPTASILFAHLSTPPPRLHEVDSSRSFSPDVQALLDQLLAKRAEHRPASAEATLALIEAMSDHEPSARAAFAPEAESARNLSPWPVARTLAPAAPARPLWGRVQRHFTQLTAAARARRPSLVAGGTGLGVVILLGLILRAARPPAPDPSPVVEADPPASEVNIVSEPSGAHVRLDGVELGATPYALRLRSLTEISLAMPGFETAKLTVSENSGPTVRVQLQALAPPAGELPRTKSAAAARPLPMASSAPQPTAAYNNVAAAKRALQSGKLDEPHYRNLIRTLKLQRRERTDAVKQAYRRGGMSRAEYARRVHAIDLEYAGK